jgi:hypothetical protein
MHNGAEEINFGAAEVWYNAGIRFHNWEVSGGSIAVISITISPRAQFLKPDWDKLTWFFQVVYTISLHFIESCEMPPVKYNQM